MSKFLALKKLKTSKVQIMFFFQVFENFKNPDFRLIITAVNQQLL